MPAQYRQSVPSISLDPQALLALSPLLEFRASGTGTRSAAWIASHFQVSRPSRCAKPRGPRQVSGATATSGAAPPIRRRTVPETPRLVDGLTRFSSASFRSSQSCGFSWEACRAIVCPRCSSRVRTEQPPSSSAQSLGGTRRSCPASPLPHGGFGFRERRKHVPRPRKVWERERANDPTRPYGLPPRTTSEPLVFPFVRYRRPSNLVLSADGRRTPKPWPANT